MHSDLLHDATVQQLEPEMFRTWVNCLCMANEHKVRGQLPDRLQVAWSLRIDAAEAEDRCVALVHEGLLEMADDARTFRIHNWDRWQGTPDDSSERVKRHRAKLRARKASGLTLTCPGAKAMPYSEYLNTPYWQMRRKGKLAAADFKCSACGGDGILDVHHNTYERLGEELDSDLVVLCRDCHGLFHGNGKLADPPL